MKKSLITIMILLAILLLSLTIASCTPAEVTKTVTSTLGPTVIVVPTEPPDIPHELLIDIGGSNYFVGEEPLCWFCHSQPASPDHTGFWLDEDFCTQCHKMSDQPLLVPHFR
ncbi:hypothetical protein ACFLYS_01680 [Chloroflexota bacterium]